jgi:hypothetical protein
MIQKKGVVLPVLAGVLGWWLVRVVAETAKKV